MKKLIAENQLMGDGSGYAFFRNLYENEDGSRISVKTSKTFWMQDERKLGDSYPSQTVLFEKHKNN